MRESKVCLQIGCASVFGVGCVCGPQKESAQFRSNDVNQSACHPERQSQNIYY